MLACLVCTKAGDEVGGDDQQHIGSKTIESKHGSIRLFTFQLKQMATRITTGALYRSCRPACIQVSRNDMLNGNPVVHPSSDELHETSSVMETPEVHSQIAHSPQFSLKSYKLEERDRSPIRSYTSPAQNTFESNSMALVPSKPLQRVNTNATHAALSEDGSPHTSAGSVLVKGVDSEWVAQVEPGVYITFNSSPDGYNDLKRIKFSRSLFSKQEAESWWAQNCVMVRELYNVRPPSVPAADDDRFSSGYATPEPPNSNTSSYATRSPCGSVNGDYQLVKRNVSDVRSITSERSDGESEWVEQDEPGVYLTIIYTHGVGKQLKRVRFSRDKYSETEATIWWEQNKHRVYARYIGPSRSTQ